MKTCFYQYRKGIYEALLTLGYHVYQHVPKDATTPYIYVGDMSSTPAEDNTVYSQEVTTEIHVVTSYFGDQGSYNTIDDITDEVTQLLITMGRTTEERAAAIDMDDFEATPNQLTSLSQEVAFDDVYKEIRNIISMVALIDQNLEIS